MKRRLADLYIEFWRLFHWTAISQRQRFMAINWAYGEQSREAW